MRIHKDIRTIRTIRRGAVTRNNSLLSITPYNSFRSYFCKFNLHNAKRQWSPLLFAFAQGALSPCVPIHRITLFGYSIHMNDFGPISGCILSFTPNNFLFGRVQPVASSCWIQFNRLFIIALIRSFSGRCPVRLLPMLSPIQFTIVRSCTAAAVWLNCLSHAFQVQREGDF